MNRIVFLVVLLIWCQVASQEIKGTENTEGLDVRYYKLVDNKYDLQKRSLSDIWNSIKSTANHLWNYIQNITNNTQKRIAKWIAKIKTKANDLGRAFELRLNKIKVHLNNIIDKIKVTGEVVKRCLQEHKKEIDDILKNILIDVTNCITNSITHLNNLAALQNATIPTKTDFFKVIQNDVNKCLEKSKGQYEIEECIQNIRNNTYNNVGVTEVLILQNYIEKTRASNDLLDTIAECTTNGIIKSTTIIANETIHIIECVAKG